MQDIGSRMRQCVLCAATLLCALPGALVASATEVARNQHQTGMYPAVREGKSLVFPKDNGAHPDYRTEWWYITGWLTDQHKNERGFQVTFFRVRPLIGEDNPSRFAPSQLIFAHAAIADPAEGRLLHADRVGRALDPISGARTDRTHVWLDDWMLDWQQGGMIAGERYHASVSAADFSFELYFQPDGAPLPNGRNGFSQKTPDPLNASYYYSRPQLATSGKIEIRGKTYDVTGHAWLDHEWSSEILPENASGWDWIGINLHDGGSLMAFQMRDGEGKAIWHAATYRPGKAQAQILQSHQLRFTPLRHWRSSRTGTNYPVEWQLDLAGRQLTVTPLFDDQEMDSRASTGAIYWEGAVRLKEADTEIGRGYLEMTGYTERLNM